MTIIKPNHKFKHAKFLGFLCVILIVMGGIYVFEYNSLVNVRYSLRKAKTTIKSAEQDNNNLKNQIFNITDPEKMIFSASLHSLVLEQNPEYLSVNQ